MRKVCYYYCFFLWLGCLSACKQHPSADSIVIGRIWTANAAQPWAEAMAVVGDSIAAIGDEATIAAWRGERTVVINTDTTNLIVPGFIDCHTHFVEGGMALSSVQLRDAKTPGEFIRRIAEYARTLEKGAWITEGDWDHENWGGVLPTRGWIDSVTRNHPVWINRLDGHMCLANSAALEIAGITDDVMDVAGGTIVRNGRGRLTGVFKDNAMALVSRSVPPPTPGQEDEALESAMRYVTARGVTSVHNMSGFQDVFQRAYLAGKLKIRIYAGRPLSEWRLLAEEINQQGRGDKWLRRGGLKEFVDGSLGSHTAAFFQPFDDTPLDSGFFVIEEAVLLERIKSADSAGLQVMVHAIGDRAIHTLLKTFEAVINKNGERDRRFRIEHAQHIDPSDIASFSRLHVIPSMQPYQAIDDGRWAEKVIGNERSRTTYAFNDLLRAKAMLVFGSDWFVAPPTPLEGIYAAVTRRTLDDQHPEGWIPEQRISVEEALRSYTTRAAHASFEEDIKGSLVPGKLADYVILERDIFSIPPTEIKDVNIISTVVGGMEVYKH
jgi:predicted amidohydrolase YtcJ